MKHLFVVLFSLVSVTAGAQNAGSGASQQLELALNDVLGVSMSTPGGGGGGGGIGTVDIPFTGINAMSDGVESPDIEVNLTGTAPFEITVHASSNNFTYTGASNSNNTMPVADVLTLVVTGNNTGGTISNNFSSYQPINGTTSKKLIDQGQPGVRSFTFKYKATPGFDYAAGMYTTDIIFTLTKL